MKVRRLTTSLVLMVGILFNLTMMPFPATLMAAANEAMVDIVDDFESGLPSGVDGNGIPIGFYTWGDDWNGTTVGISTVTVPDTDPLALPGQTGDNALLQVDSNVVSWGGLTHHFENETVDTWVPQDWSTYEGISFWLYGNNSGTTVFFEVQDNRNPGSTVDDTEIWNYTFADDFAGWQHFQIPFSAFVRKDIGNGAPNDGFNLTEVHGWAFGSLNTGGPITYYLDDVALVVRTTVVDDFESGLPSGVDGNGIPIGFYTWGDDWNGTTVGISTVTVPDTDPLALPGQTGDNALLQVDSNVVSWGGLTHHFENETVDTWVPQDWSTYEGISFWLYGNNSGTTVFFEVQDNRNPGSTVDDTEIWNYTFADDFAGWQHFQIPFSAFVRKDIGNGAPNDGFNLTEVHGWAFGSLNTGGPITYHLDQVTIYGNTGAEIPLEVAFSASELTADEGVTAVVTVELIRPLNEDDPEQVSVSYTTEPGTAIPDRDYTPVAGTLTFVRDGATEQTFTIPTWDNLKYDGDKTVILRLANPVDIALGFLTQSVLVILDDDPLDPTLIDDFERGAYLWTTDGDVTLATPEIAAGDPLAVPGQGAYEHILEATAPMLVDMVVSGGLCNEGNGVVPVAILTTDNFDATTVDHNTVRLGNAAETHRDKKTGEADRHEEDFEGDGDTDLIFHFRVKETGYDCDTAQPTLTGETFDGQPIIAGGEGGFSHDFAMGQDWTRGEALSFWFYGTDSGDAITVQLKDNRAPDPGASGWGLVWSDEFDDPAGTPPNPAYWSYEIGDGAANRIPGWGNSELQYYTNSTDNSATDGTGNLVITAQEADGSLVCYYGPCEYTSARLISQYKAEFAYGRIESRIRVPQGAGLWPAFWSLGTDIGEVGWPQTGEIDIMEFVGREPYEVFGTIHGPGYSGGASFGDTYTFDVPVYEGYHTFAIEWQPDLIEWYVDDILYHTATPPDVAPNEWVYNHPFFIIMNVAVGGNFGGPVGEDTVFPQEMLVDYLRVYQGPDTAERWEVNFADNFDGWQQVVIPFASLTRSADQPAGAPDDGLGLNEVWGYSFKLPEGGTSTGKLRFDQVRLELAPPPTEITVTNFNDSGDGSLRQALEDIAIGGTITFDPSLAGGTITLSSGPLVPVKSVTIDGADAPGLSLSGGGVDRVLIVDAGLTVNLAHLTATNGYGWQLAGGILNNGTLTLDHVTVTGNTMATDAGDFWQGGGGIYSGEGASLTLVDSSVVDNNAGWSGGGVYSFFNTTTTIVRSTISGNVSNDTGGGIRSLGNAEIINSTISGNTATGWHGGAIFHTDGTMEILNSTIANNVGPDWASSAIFLGEWGTVVPVLQLTNTIITGNQWYACEQYASGGTVSLISGGHNLVQDDSCNPVASDLIVGDAGIGPLADNGGPTLTHALMAGSLAIDAGDNAVCPGTDQRGVARPQGAACDVGSYEYE